MARINKNQKLTLELLHTEVPLLHAGEAAKTTLKEQPPKDIKEIQQLQQTVTAGNKAQERLIQSSLSFVVALAKKEQSRRSQWGSSVPLDDIIQEGLAGLIRGFHAYNPNVPQKSATNYLGQWVTTQMRRGLESMDHAFSVPQEAIERHRKIRAIRSRLESELGRKPTNEEIVTAARESKGKYGDTKMGRLKKIESSIPRSRDITLEHIKEEQTFSTRTGALMPTERQIGDSEDTFDSIDISTSESLSQESSDKNIEDVDTQSGHSMLSTLLESTINKLQLPNEQQTIIRMKYGLPPYDSEHTMKVIVSTTKVPKHKVKQIIDAFTEELTTPQSIFHQETSKLNDDLHAIGIGWVVDALGNFNPQKPLKKINPLLNQEIKQTTKKPKTTMPAGVLSKTNRNYQNQHTYHCPIHGDFTLYIEETPSQTTFCNVDNCLKIATLTH